MVCVCVRNREGRRRRERGEIKESYCSHIYLFSQQVFVNACQVPHCVARIWCVTDWVSLVEGGVCRSSPLREVVAQLWNRQSQQLFGAVVSQVRPRGLLSLASPLL